VLESQDIPLNDKDKILPKALNITGDHLFFMEPAVFLQHVPVVLFVSFFSEFVNPVIRHR
jgi:hypothetical protein